MKPVAEAVSRLVSRLELAAQYWRYLQERASLLEPTLNFSLLRIHENLGTFLDRIKNQAQALEKAGGYQGWACVTVRDGLITSMVFIEYKCRKMLEDVTWQHEEGFKVLRVEQLELIILEMKRDVLRGNWPAAVSLLNRNRVA